MEGGGGGGNEEEELNDVVHRESHQIDDWSSATNTLEHVAKANLVPSTSRLLFLTVEYVEDPGGNGSNPSFTTFEGETFQQLADLEQRVVSPLDPNMSCTACYSPVQYNVSRPASPYQSSHAIIVNSSSAQVHTYLNDQQSQSSGTNTPVTSQSSSTGLIVMEDQFSSHHSSDNYVVTSSGRIIAGYPTDNTDDANQNVINSDKLLLNSSTEMSLVPSEMAVTGLKPSEDGRLELLLSNGTIAYGLVETESGLVASPSSIIQVKIPREYILAAGRTDEENGPLCTIYNTLKTQGLIVEPTDVGELRLVSELEQSEQLLDSTLLEQSALLEEQVGNIADAINNSVNESFSKEIKNEMKGYWCEDCNKTVGTECAEHCIDSIICDKPVPSRARATLPAAYLAINKLPNSDIMYGVFARKTIPKRTQFGPIEGVLVKSEDITIISTPECGASQLDLLIEMDDGEMRKLDVSNENSSNWMRFVRPASNVQQQNLVLSQQGLSLYFTTTQTIHPKQELQVWYSSAYAIKRNLSLLKAEEKEQDWPCFECDQKFNSSENLQKHLNVHDTERGDEAKPKKTNLHATRRSVQKHLAPIKKYKIGEKKKLKSPYECTICKRTFPRSYSLKRHLLLLHSGENKYLCSVCQLGFSHLFNLDRHMKRVHKKSSIFNQSQDGKSKKENCLVCVHCKLTFTSASMLNLHTLTHTADNLENESILGISSVLSNNKENLKCPQCTQAFQNKRDLIQHVSKHGKKSVSRSQDKQYRCQNCFKSFATCDRLQMHTLVHGDDDNKPLQCNVCKKRFLNNSALSCHLRTHSMAKLFECPMCKATFDQVLLLKSHVHLHSKNGLFFCPHCNKKFEEYSLIRKHIRAFHCDRKHKCTYCGKLFLTLDKLRMHMLRHSDHREFLCANCGKQFKRKDKLKEHMKRMHSVEREQQIEDTKPPLTSLNKKVLSKIVVNTSSDYERFIYKCHTCMSGFKRRGMLVNHLANRHPDITPASVPELNLPILKTTRDYYCQYCEKIYKSSSKRKAHILKNHPGAELPMSNRQKGGVPDIPGLPNPTFSQTVGSVTTNPHGCQWCHKQYASKAKLLQHQRKKHLYLLPRSQQQPRPLKNPSQEENEVEEKNTNQETNDKTSLIRPVPVALSMNNSISMLPDYDIVTADADFTDSGIVIDTSTLKRAIKGDVITADLLTQAMSELGASASDIQAISHDQYVKLVQTSSGIVAQAVDMSDNFNTHESFYTPYTAR